MCFFNSSNKCVDARNYDEMNEIILESTWILLLEGRWRDEFTLKTPFSKGKYYNEYDITKLIPKREINDKYTCDNDIKIE